MKFFFHNGYNVSCAYFQIIYMMANIIHDLSKEWGKIKNDGLYRKL